MVWNRQMRALRFTTGERNITCRFGNLRIYCHYLTEIWTPGNLEIRTSGIPETRTSGFLETRTSENPDFRNSGIPESRNHALSKVHGLSCKNSECPGFRNSGFPEFPAFRIPEFPNSGFPEFRISRYPEIRTFEAPSPSGVSANCRKTQHVSCLHQCIYTLAWSLLT